MLTLSQNDTYVTKFIFLAPILKNLDQDSIFFQKWLVGYCSANQNSSLTTLRLFSLRYRNAWPKFTFSAPTVKVQCDKAWQAWHDILYFLYKSIQIIIRAEGTIQILTFRNVNNLVHLREFLQCYCYCAISLMKILSRILQTGTATIDPPTIDPHVITLGSNVAKSRAQYDIWLQPFFSCC